LRHMAIEMPRRIRINIVSPGWVRETLVKLGMDPEPGAPVRIVAQAYVAAVEGSAQGEVIAPARQ
jgi:hypothetical protein